MNVGKLYCVSFYPSSPWLLGCGGSGNQLALWNLESEEAFQSRFGGRVLDNKNGHNLPQGTTGGDDEQEETQPEEDFEAIMAASDQAAVEAKEKAVIEKKKKGNKSKKKVHKKR